MEKHKGRLHKRASYFGRVYTLILQLRYIIMNVIA